MQRSLAAVAVMVALIPTGDLVTIAKNRSRLCWTKHVDDWLIPALRGCFLPSGIFRQLACYIVWIDLCRKPDPRENA